MYYDNGVDITSLVEPQVSSILLQPSDTCTESWETTISLVANRTFQKLSLACYVVNEQFPAGQAGCSSANFCSQLDISILYGVSSITANSVPHLVTDEGSTVTLSCYADGNPKPSYTWTKADDADRRLNVIQDGDGSKVVLANLNLQQDNGTYK
ncbi:uncharacterized protein LOC131932193 [Physella acuta]|uniref:uncharacterized protein LOC131932193 n=1 Tax=Physella acuta TaxID=109671 RepID=UPI0027DEA614|nr:uncharacterized protein LOC131932193 [Physella acuta]